LAKENAMSTLPNLKEKGQSLQPCSLMKFKRNKLSLFGLALVALIFMAAIFAPFITKYDPYEQLVWSEGESVRLVPPCVKHWFGTDIYGRDIYTRVIYGARISLQIGFVATAMSVVVGVILGTLAGYYGGLVDDIITWVTNVIFAFPFLLFVIALLAYLKPNLLLLYLSIGAVSWAPFARVSRGQVLQIKQMEYVEAAIAIGSSDSRIIFKHILPNIIGPIIVQASLEIGNIIMLESSLSFLGFGIQPPEPAWGYMINEGRQFFLSGQWWWSVFPGVAIMVLVLGFNLLGDGLRDILDPR
jgi:ABC-type dipeptide/oligopeptide/nickel transport system permease subunit